MDFVWFVLTAQKELEALLGICFTPTYVFLIFLQKICLYFYSPIFFERIFFSHILGSHLYKDSQVNGQEKM